MELRIIKNGNNQNSLKRTIAFFGFLIISVAFCMDAYKGRITAEMFLTYPLGLVILYAPALAIKLLEIWKGKINTGGAE